MAAVRQTNPVSPHWAPWWAFGVNLDLLGGGRGSNVSTNEMFLSASGFDGLSQHGKFMRCRTKQYIVNHNSPYEPQKAAIHDIQSLPVALYCPPGSAAIPA